MTTFTDASLSVNGQALRALQGSPPADAGAAPLVLLLHGFGVTADMWRPNLPMLIEAGYSVLAPDLPGHGASFRPRRPYGMEDLARVVIGLLEAIGQKRVYLIGNSLGGAVASEIALAQPGRVAGLVLENAFGLDPAIPALRRANYWTDLLLPGTVQVVAGPQAWTWRRLMRMIYYAPERVPPDVTMLHYPGGWWHNYGGRALIGWGVFWQLVTRRRRQAFAQRRAQLAVPTLIVWGEDDRLLPVEHGHRAHALIPGARLRVFPRCGHAPNIEQAEAFNREVIAFFQENSG